MRMNREVILTAQYLITLCKEKGLSLGGVSLADNVYFKTYKKEDDYLDLESTLIKVGVSSSANANHKLTVYAIISKHKYGGRNPIIHNYCVEWEQKTDRGTYYYTYILPKELLDDYFII